MNHIHRQAALSLLKSGHSVTAATVQGGWRGRPDAPSRSVRNLAGSLIATRLGNPLDDMLDILHTNFAGEHRSDRSLSAEYPESVNFLTHTSEFLDTPSEFLDT